MATTVVKSIGTSSRDYSTLQAWEDACPANLVSVDQIWKGECYNDSEFTAGLTIAGITCDATHYVELTAAAGQSFQDHANVRTNALKYNQSNGVAIVASVLYGRVIYTNVGYQRISRLQIRNTSTNGGCFEDANGLGVMRDLIFDSTGACVNDGAATGNTFINCLAIQRAGSGNGFLTGNGDQHYGCVVIHPSDVGAGGNAFHVGFAYGSNRIAQSCAAFGFTNFSDNVTSVRWDTTNSKNNATDAAAAPGSSNQVSVTYSQFTPFTDADKDSSDFRAIAGTSLINNGFLNSTYPLDISKTTRSSTPTIGCWEVVAASTTPRISQLTTELISQNLIVPDPRISQLAVEALTLRRDLTPTLVGHWPMNEASGPAIDVHGDNDLTLLGTVDHGQDPIDGTPARHLTQTDKNYFKHVDNSDLRLGANEGFTWITRFKLNSSGFDFYIVDKSLPPIGYSIFWVGTLGFIINFDNGYENATQVTAPGIGNDWTDLSGNFGQTFVVAAGYNSATRKLWIRVNKETRVEANWTANTILKNQTDLFVGADHDDLVNPQESLDGAIGPVSFFKGNLTDSEIDYWIDNKGSYSEIGGDIATITDPRISQQAIEVITSLTAAATDPRISQLAIELITLIPQPRISQLVVELVSLVTPDSRISQIAVELISLTEQVPRVSQLAVELITLISEVRVSQLAVELISLPTPSARVSQLAVEMMSLIVVSDPRVSQLTIELLSLQPIVFTEKTEFFIVAG